MAAADIPVGLIKKSQLAAGSRPSLLIAVLVLIIHLIAVGLLLHDRAAKPDRPRESLIQLRLLPSDIAKVIAPTIDLYRPPPSTAVTIAPLEPWVIESDEPAGTAAAPEPFVQGDSGIFDPRLRKKLSDIGARAAAQPFQALNSWRDASGVEIVEVKQGECIRVMPGAANDPGTNWSLRFKCGKSEGERMVDHINADMAGRNRKKIDK